MALTPDQKKALANLLIQRAADIGTQWEERRDDHAGLEQADHDDVMDQLAVWLKRLPGNGWDYRLPCP